MFLYAMVPAVSFILYICVCGVLLCVLVCECECVNGVVCLCAYLFVVRVCVVLLGARRCCCFLLLACCANVLLWRVVVLRYCDMCVVFLLSLFRVVAFFVLHVV